MRGRRGIVLIFDFVLPLCFLIAAAHHFYNFVHHRLNLLDRFSSDPSVVFVRQLDRYVSPQRLLPYWVQDFLASLSDRFHAFFGNLFYVLWVTIVPVDEFLTYGRARWVSVCNFLSPVHSLVLTPLLAAFGVGFSVVGAIVRSLSAGVRAFSMAVFTPLYAVGRLIAGLFHARIAWGLPTPGKSVGWWRWVSAAVMQVLEFTGLGGLLGITKRAENSGGVVGGSAAGANTSGGGGGNNSSGGGGVHVGGSSSSSALDDDENSLSPGNSSWPSPKSSPHRTRSSQLLFPGPSPKSLGGASGINNSKASSTGLASSFPVGAATSGSSAAAGIMTMIQQRRPPQKIQQPRTKIVTTSGSDENVINNPRLPSDENIDVLLPGDGCSSGHAEHTEVDGGRPRRSSAGTTSSHSSGSSEATHVALAAGGGAESFNYAPEEDSCRRDVNHEAKDSFLFAAKEKEREGVDSSLQGPLLSEKTSSSSFFLGEDRSSSTLRAPGSSEGVGITAASPVRAQKLFTSPTLGPVVAEPGGRGSTTSTALVEPAAEEVRRGFSSESLLSSLPSMTPSATSIIRRSAPPDDGARRKGKRTASGSTGRTGESAVERTERTESAYNYYPREELLARRPECAEERNFPGESFGKFPVEGENNSVTEDLGSILESAPSQSVTVAFPSGGAGDHDDEDPSSRPLTEEDLRTGDRAGAKPETIIISPADTETRMAAGLADAFSALPGDNTQDVVAFAAASPSASSKLSSLSSSEDLAYACSTEENNIRGAVVGEGETSTKTKHPGGNVDDNNSALQHQLQLSSDNSVAAKTTSTLTSGTSTDGSCARPPRFLRVRKRMMCADDPGTTFAASSELQRADLCSSSSGEPCEVDQDDHLLYRGSAGDEKMLWSGGDRGGRERAAAVVEDTRRSVALSGSGDAWAPASGSVGSASSASSASSGCGQAVVGVGESFSREQSGEKSSAQPMIMVIQEDLGRSPRQSGANSTTTTFISAESATVVRLARRPPHLLRRVALAPLDIGPASPRAVPSARATSPRQESVAEVATSPRPGDTTATFSDHLPREDGLVVVGEGTKSSRARGDA